MALAIRIVFCVFLVVVFVIVVATVSGAGSARGDPFDASLPGSGATAATATRIATARSSGRVGQLFAGNFETAAGFCEEILKAYAQCCRGSRESEGDEDNQK